MVTITPLSPALAGSFFSFFDLVAFSDNPEWQKCYCYFYPHDPVTGDWEARSGAENRAAAGRDIFSGTLKGYLAFSDGEVVGWCNANDKKSYPLLCTERELWEGEPGGARVSAIVCFLVSPGNLRQGIARLLLDAACADYSSRAYDFIEAYPRKDARTAASQYHGPLSLYEAAGFAVHRELDTYWIVRKTLRQGA